MGAAGVVELLADGVELVSVPLDRLGRVGRISTAEDTPEVELAEDGLTRDLDDPNVPNAPNRLKAACAAASLGVDPSDLDTDPEGVLVSSSPSLSSVELIEDKLELDPECEFDDWAGEDAGAAGNGMFAGTASGARGIDTGTDPVAGGGSE